MNITALTLTLLALSLFLGCGEPDPPTPLVDRAIEAMGGREALAAVTSVYLKLEGDFLPGGEGAEKTSYAAEHLVLPPDSYAIRVVFGGLVTRRALSGDRSWTRSGAAVADLSGDQTVEEQADRDDYLSLLLVPALAKGFVTEKSEEPNRIRLVSPRGLVRSIYFDPATGLPSRMERTAIGGGDSILVRHYEGWGKRGPILLPTRIRAESGGSRLDLAVTEAVVNGTDHDPALTARPRDVGEPKTKPIRQIRTKGGNFLTVEHKGPLTDLAKVDLLIEQALTISKSGRRGPNRRVFRQFAGEDGIAVVVTFLPVTLSRDRSAGDLPRGVAVRTLDASEALAMEFTGPYPSDSSLQDMLENYGKDLGLVATAPPHYVVLSDPNEGEPAGLRQEIRLPVRKAE
jgi:hypothetical protein